MHHIIYKKAGRFSPPKICKAEHIKIVKRMLVSGKLTYEDILDFTDLTLEEIKALAVQKTE